MAACEYLRFFTSEYVIRVCNWVLKLSDKMI
jgi:hypothetical protein